MTTRGAAVVEAVAEADTWLLEGLLVVVLRGLQLPAEVSVDAPRTSAGTIVTDRIFPAVAGGETTESSGGNKTWIEAKTRQRILRKPYRVYKVPRAIVADATAPDLEPIPTATNQPTSSKRTPKILTTAVSMRTHSYHFAQGLMKLLTELMEPLGQGEKYSA